MGLARERLEREHAAFAARTAGNRAVCRGTFLGDRVPLAAGVALAGPAAIGRPAVLADEGGGVLGHGALCGGKVPKHSRLMRTIQEHTGRMPVGGASPLQLSAATSLCA